MSGFDIPNPVPEAIRKFLGLNEDLWLPRTEVANQIYTYVREKNLRDQEDRRIIHPDMALQKLFNLKQCETLDFDNFPNYLSYHYSNSEDKEDNKSEKKIETEEDLYAQIEELKKKAEELRNKAKEMEDQNKDTEFNKQRNFLIDTVRNFLNMSVTDEEICAVLYRFYGAHINHPQSHTPISYYLKKEDENMLFERKVFNRYAKCNEIRYEDSLEIISNFITKIKSKDQVNIQGERRRATPKNIHNQKIPLFY
jgi:hypothetical protein